MTKKEKLELMGKVVMVTHTLELSYDEKKYRGSRAAKLEHPRPGWVVGISHRCEGHYQSSGYMTSDPWGMEPPDYDPPYLAVTRCVPVLKVAFWFNSKPVDVPLDGWHHTNEKPMATTHQYYSVYDKKTLSEIMKAEVVGWARWPNGRWKAYKDFTEKEREFYREARKKKL